MVRRLSVLLITVSLIAWGCALASAPTAAPSLPGTAGHFDDGQEAFDYPLDWNVLSGSGDEGGVEYVISVLGDGTWASGCGSATVGSVSSTICHADSASYPPGGIVVKVYRWWGGPLVPCRGDIQANATLGSLAVRKTTSGDVTTWEIRLPGSEFGQNNNVLVEAHTSDPFQLTKAEQLVASFHWIGNQPGMNCPSTSPA